MRVFVKFFFEKLLLGNYRLDFYQISQERSMEVQNFSSLLQKNQACGAIQVLKCLLFFDRVENTAGKEEYADYHHFLLFQQCFQKASYDH